ncbi:hypothetical protein [Streptomyces cyaneochromogenes]|nr:hypothetical protein [Streptomyces cyaneochromogenes]
MSSSSASSATVGRKKLQVSSRAEVAAVVGRAHRPGREAGAA